MRKPSPSSAQTPDEVGKQVAGELKGAFLSARQQIAAQRIEERSFLNTTEQIRRALLRAVEVYNDHVPRELQLAVLDRGDRLIFNSLGEFTLTLTYGIHQLMIDATGGDAGGLSPMTLRVWRDKGDLHFHSVPDSPVFQKSILDEGEFVYSVLRMACSRRFAGAEDC
jgi:hypothetical protein